MSDKSFNDEPMLVVVSDALDPRIKRQLQSQLQAEMMTVGELDAEIKNQESMQAIKQQYDSKKDESEFNEDETKEEGNAAPVEQTAAADENNSAGDEFGAQGSDSSSGSEGGNGDQSGNAEADNGNSDAFSADESNVQGAEQSQGQQAPAQPDQSQQAGGDDPFGGDDGQAQAQENPKQNSVPEQAKAQQPAAPANPPAAGNNDAGDDPFSDDVKFEAFAGIFNDAGMKFEDVAKQTDATKDTHPPLKQVVVVSASDRGVDERTNHVVAALQDPQNTVVVIDMSDVGEAEAKMQFSAMKKSLQERGVTVVDTIDQAVDYLNDVYDQISGKAE